MPSLNHNYQKAVNKNEALIEWIKDQYKNGSEIASMCTGAFLLAATGLLNGKSCSTHWGFADTLKNMFPKIKVEADRLITDEGGIYTNGGAYSFLNLVLYLVEKYFDRQTSIYCSKVFQIEMDRERQSEFIIFRGQKEHQDEVVKKHKPTLKRTLMRRYPLKNFQKSWLWEEGILTEDLLKPLTIHRSNIYKESK
ncbi:DJ-1/PfpI family protein [Niabella ginsengisoli]|uniref:DJ-1/PfpI family protein n=1 Tax=Niabella ginsengisoli TaxID=522298 RepID=A0ABS9SKI6_9BACT|nr:DJ-1/PfpI family protein [Niabella ginsengisoli]